MRTTHVLLIVATLLASFASAVPAAGATATCVQNSGKCTGDATCIQNSGSCSGSGTCGTNDGSCSGGICGTNAHDYVGYGGTCSGGICGENNGGYCTGGWCGINNGKPPSNTGGHCSGGICGDNNGGDCTGGTCVYNTGACNGGICVVNSGTCNPGGICVINSGVCGSGYGGTIGGGNGCHANTAITLTRVTYGANVNDKALSANSWSFRQTYATSAATPNACFSDAVSADRTYTSSDSTFTESDNGLTIRHVSQQAGSEPVLETTTLAYAPGGAYFTQVFQSFNGQVLWQGQGFLGALADANANSVTIGHQ